MTGACCSCVSIAVDTLWHFSGEAFVTPTPHRWIWLSVRDDGQLEALVICDSTNYTKSLPGRFNPRHFKVLRAQLCYVGDGTGDIKAPRGYTTAMCHRPMVLL